jgi:hypothetical protein
MMYTSTGFEMLKGGFKTTVVGNANSPELESVSRDVVKQRLLLVLDHFPEGSDRLAAILTGKMWIGSSPRMKQLGTTTQTCSKGESRSPSLRRVNGRR